MKSQMIAPIIALMFVLPACGGGPDNIEEAGIAELHDRMQRGEIAYAFEQAAGMRQAPDL